MAKASLSLPNGTIVRIEGTSQEIRQLLDFYSGQPTKERSSPAQRKSFIREEKAKETASSNAIDLAQVINLAKDCDEADVIEKQIFDKSSQLNRTLLPLYVVHEYLDNAFGLTSGDINKVTTDLGIPISTANASHTFSGAASRYVIGDKVKKQGQPVRYKLSRKGLKYVKAVLEGKGKED